MSSSSSSYVPSIPIPVFVQDRGSCGPERENQAGDLGLLRPEGGVRIFNGRAIFSSNLNLTAKGLNLPFSTKLSYDSGAGANPRGFGNNWVPLCLPKLTKVGGLVTYERGSLEKIVFLSLGSGIYQATYFSRNHLIYDIGTDEFTLTSQNGAIERFDGNGRLLSFSSPGGRTAVVDYDGDLVVSVTAVNGSDSWKVEFKPEPPVFSRSTEELYEGWINETILYV